MNIKDLTKQTTITSPSRYATIPYYNTSRQNDDAFKHRPVCTYVYACIGSTFTRLYLETTLQWTILEVSSYMLIFQEN